MAPRATIRTADRHPAEPGHAGPDAVTAEAAAHGHEPAESVGHGDGQRRGPVARRQRDAPVLVPAHGRAADALEAVGQVVVVGGHRVGPGRPHDDLVGRPRRLEPHLAGGVGGDEHGVGGVGRPGQPVVGELEALELGLEVGEDLVALGTPERSRAASRLSSVSSSMRSRARAATRARRTSSRASCSVVATPSTAAQAADSIARVASSIRQSGAPPRRTPRRQGDPGECGPAQAVEEHHPGRGVPLRWAGLQTSSSIGRDARGGTDRFADAPPACPPRGGGAPGPVRYDEPSRTGV